MEDESTTVDCRRQNTSTLSVVRPQEVARHSHTRRQDPSPPETPDVPRTTLQHTTTHCPALIRSVTICKFTNRNYDNAILRKDPTGSLDPTIDNVEPNETGLSKTTAARRGIAGPITRHRQEDVSGMTVDEVATLGAGTAADANRDGRVPVYKHTAYCRVGGCRTGVHVGHGRRSVDVSSRVSLISVGGDVQQPQSKQISSTSTHTHTHI